MIFVYCSKCGTRNEGNKFCTNCGMKLENISNVNTGTGVKTEEKNGLKTASLVLGIISIISSILLVFSPIGLMLAIIGLVLGIVASKSVKNVVGIVLNSVGLFISIVVISLLIWLVVAFINDNNDYVVDDNYNYGDEYNYDDFGSFDDMFDQFFGGDFGEFFGGEFDEYVDENPNKEYY